MASPEQLLPTDIGRRGLTADGPVRRRRDSLTIAGVGLNQVAPGLTAQPGGRRHESDDDGPLTADSRPLAPAGRLTADLQPLAVAGRLTPDLVPERLTADLLALGAIAGRGKGLQPPAQQQRRSEGGGLRGRAQ